MAASPLREPPAPLRELVRHIAQHPELSMTDILAPYRSYEAYLRELYAQDRQNPVLDDGLINVIPVFSDDVGPIVTRARNLALESSEEKSKYILPLPDNKRRPQGSPATVANLAEFQRNFNVFSESSLVEMNWTNVVAAGSSVVNCLLPTPPSFGTSKRKLREYYHDRFCPASDVDLFLYGLDEQEAIAKIKHIEQAVRDAILYDVTVVRTKYAITIASQHPVRHVQIVLRLYKSLSEILTGFDIDAAGAAYDGKQVYLTPRALASFITQINHIDLTRRSPSYENRLSKYTHRNFEIFWPQLDRSRIDPTIFERSFRRTLGLARLLVLEQLPTHSAREEYLNRRRLERSRPPKLQKVSSLRGNIKDSYEDEIAEWQPDDDVSNYNTFTVPYGQGFNAKRIEKLCYTRDLLLNAEWNQPKDRKVYLHRHPAFFGRVEDVMGDCCAHCPAPTTPEEKDIADKESQIYISGSISFIVDDPGRQRIGSFKPLTDRGWTDMAYVGDNARLCQSIVDADTDAVLKWLHQKGADINKRDHTGRTPLHLAVMASSPSVVDALVKHGARLTARLADGKTALHLAASRGNVDIIKILMARSIKNEEADEGRQSKRRKVILDVRQPADGAKAGDGKERENVREVDFVPIDVADDTRVPSVSSDSFVKVEKEDASAADDDIVAADDAANEPDYFHVDVLAWDVPCSPLHLAIVEAREAAVESLFNYGADVVLPIKLPEDFSGTHAVILTLSLALALPREKAKSMARLLLKLGATSSQADSSGYTALQTFVGSGRDGVIDAILEIDKARVKTALNHVVFSPQSWNPRINSPIHSAAEYGDSFLVLKLLNAGALPQVDFDSWLRSARLSMIRSSLGDLESSRRKYQESLEQPVITAVRAGNVDAAIQLLDHGADPNALTCESQQLLIDESRRSWNKGMSVLDLVKDLIRRLSDYKGESPSTREPRLQPGVGEYLLKYKAGTYQHWVVSNDVRLLREAFERDHTSYRAEVKRAKTSWGMDEKREAIDDALSGLKKLGGALIARGGKSFDELYPNLETDRRESASRDTEVVFEDEYKFDFYFSYDSDISDTRRDGYIELMEAAWVGDLGRVKALTLDPWGPGKNNPPLKAAITDNNGNSPFSVAFLKGHKDVAQAILEIVKVQWCPPEGQEVRFRIGGDADEDSHDESPDGRLRIVTEFTGRQFTIEDIGKVSMAVDSHVRPLDVLCSWAPTFLQAKGKVVKELDKRSMFLHAIDTEDSSKLRFLLDMANHFSGQKLERGRNKPREIFALAEDDFTWALAHGKTQMLKLLMRKCGAGIPLDHLVQMSVMEVKRKARYYQGLTVYGSKRRHWASDQRETVPDTTAFKPPPLLYAALGGSLEVVELFMGDAPLRLYGEYGRSKKAKADYRIKHLDGVPGGFQGAVSRWLGAGSDLVIHCAVLSEATAESGMLLEYLVRARPNLIEKRTGEGETPLMLACRLGRIAYIKQLLEVDADQSTRNNKGENILHAALWGLPSAERIGHLLRLLDEDLRGHLFRQRTKLSEGGRTPLHSWILQACGQRSLAQAAATMLCDDPLFGLPPEGYRSRRRAVEMAKLLLSYSEGKELDILDGASETCLHTVVQTEMICLVKVLVDHDPRQLLRENAVGHTPAELAHDRLQDHMFERPERSFSNQDQNKLALLPDRPPREFVDKAVFMGKSLRALQSGTGSLGLSGDYDADAVGPISYALGRRDGLPGWQLSPTELKRITWDLCSTALRTKQAGGTRRLVTLSEASDVARRLSEKEPASPRIVIVGDGEGGGAEEANGQNGDGTSASDFIAGELASRRGSAWRFSRWERTTLGLPAHDDDDDEDQRDA